MAKAKIMNKPSDFTIRYIHDPKEATIVEEFLCDIFMAVKDRVLEAYHADLPEITNMQPRTLTNMIAANIIVNMARCSLSPNITLEMRLEAMEEIIDELSEIIRFVWRTVEVIVIPEENMQ